MISKIFTTFLSFNIFFVFSFQQGAIAQDRTNPSGTTTEYTYQLDTDFDTKRTEISKMNMKISAGISNALIGIAGIIPSFTYQHWVNAECPVNFSGQISRGLMIASSAIYLANELSTFIAYRAEGKKVADSMKDFKLNEKKGDRDIQAQEEYFKTLQKIIENQKKIAIAKIAFKSIAEAAMISATGIELGTMISSRSICTSSYSSLNATKEGLLGTVMACSEPGGAIQTAVRAVDAQAIAKNEQKKVKFITKVGNFFKSILPIGIFFKTGAGAMPAQAPSKPEVNADEGVAASIKGEHATIESTGTKAIASEAAIPAWGAKCTPAIAAFASYIATQKIPLTCCGTLAITNPTLQTNPTGEYAADNSNESNDVPKVGASIEPEFIYKVVFNRLYEAGVNKIINSHDSTREKLISIAKLESEIDRDIEFLKLKDDEIKDLKLREFKLALNNSIKDKNPSSLMDILKQLSSNFSFKANANDFMKNLGFVGTLIPLLGAVIKLHTGEASKSKKARTIYYGTVSALGLFTIKQDADAIKTLKANKEAVDAQINAFLEDEGTIVPGSVDGGKDGPVNAPTSPTLSNAQVNKGDSYGSRNCIGFSGGTFSPATCPSGIKKENFQAYIPKTPNDVLNRLPKEYSLLVAGIQDAAFKASSGAYTNNPELLRGDALAMTNAAKAMRAANEKMRAQIDKESDLKPIKGEDGKMIEPVSLVKAHQEMMNLFDPNRDGEKIIDEILSGKENVGDTAPKSNVASIKQNSGSYENSNSMFNQGYGSMETSQDVLKESVANMDDGEQSLEDFIVSENDIEKRPEVSLFKILSNRYQLSYPLILRKKNVEEKK